MIAFGQDMCATPRPVAAPTTAALSSVTAMRVDDRVALDAGLRSDAMRAAGRNLREIAAGLATMLVLETVPEMEAAASPGVDTV